LSNISICNCSNLGRRSELGRRSAPSAQTTLSLGLTLLLYQDAPAAPKQQGQAVASFSLQLFAAQKASRSACSRQRPEGRARQPDTPVQTDTSPLLSTHPPVHQAPPAYLRNFVAPASLRLFGYRSSQSEDRRSHELPRFAVCSFYRSFEVLWSIQP